MWTFPWNTLASEPVRYRCGSLGEVSINRSEANPASAVVVYGEQHWPGTISGGSMTFFSPDHPNTRESLDEFRPKWCMALYQLRGIGWLE
jgi:hypothetical protein